MVYGAWFLIWLGTCNTHPDQCAKRDGWLLWQLNSQQACEEHKEIMGQIYPEDQFFCVTLALVQPFGRAG
jgi:hypothetical protein